jgi:hypothetical protein
LPDQLTVADPGATLGPVGTGERLRLEYWPQPLVDLWLACWENGASDVEITADQVRAMFDELRAANTVAIQQASVADFLPSISDTWYPGGAPVTTQTLLSECDDLYLSQTGEGKSFLSLASFALGSSAPVTAATILSRPGAVYASSDSLYVAVRHYAAYMGGWFWPEEEGLEEATTVHKFAFTPGGTGSVYAASGVVKGRLLNQFSMDEHQGVLRVATTTGHLPSPDVHSTVTTLVEQGPRLEELGRVDHLAPSEDIRSVRFNGDVGFVVTFKKTDPLYVLDLDDPAAPVVRGELKIPGFSTYMHLMDDTHLLTMGYDADDQGGFAWFQGIQLQVIDVSDLANPVLLHKEVIGTRGSTSDAATDHLAFSYFKARDALAIPMTICEGGEGGSYGTQMTFSGLLVYRVTVDDGFALLGGVPHHPPSDPQGWGSSCSNWWTDSNSTVKRSAFLEDWVFSVALDLVNVAGLGDLANPVASIPLTAE